MKEKLNLITRLLLGLIFFIFGINGFLMFIQPPTPSPEAGAFIGAVIQTGYLIKIVKIIEIIAGALLLLNLYVPLALVLLGPVLFNIICIHLFLDTAGLPMDLMMMILYIRLLIDYWPTFKVLLVKRA